ncbi:hypothetical protein GCM10009624_24010 [Gordonia sinesedis]
MRVLVSIRRSFLAATQPAGRSLNQREAAPNQREAALNQRGGTSNGEAGRLLAQRTAAARPYGASASTAAANWLR